LAWRVEFSRTAARQIRKLGRQAQSDIIDYLRQRIEPADSARQFGKMLHGDKQGLWRYRVGDYRLICDVRDADNMVEVLAIGHRKDVYR
jgi:mRNA interferase RelE/StbE